ncbi:phage/plasmid primase [Rhizoclosmatium globosum]|uniref:Phage/plasmid primase n=1 Tax=Rhizoclosmatium globosum TaxID=329046 RepID=A0A1Y2CXI8_9FUNG|nr:phage/plasmid primase [Rhizoclosmatium globosum]|eukprot:ORY51687.1 phage/plasmid primase [Rhizoclosmatium globosum]
MKEKEAPFVWEYKSTTAEATHTSLAGGRFYVLRDRLDEFWKQYASAVVLRKERCFLSERVSKSSNGFRFFVDLDFSFDFDTTNNTTNNSTTDNNDNQELKHQVLHAVTQWMGQYQLESRVFVSARGPKMHVVFPELILVDSKTAEALLKTMEPFFRSSTSTRFHDKVLDASVYNSGLRMLLAHKPADKDKDPNWVQAKVYRPLDDNLQELEPSSIEQLVGWLRDASILNHMQLEPTAFEFLAAKRVKRLDTNSSSSEFLTTEFKAAIPDFEALLDANPALLGFTNGVFDLEAKAFRAAVPTDYISMTCGYDFDSTADAFKRSEILGFFEDIQPDTSERDYLLKFLGSTLHGTKKDELFHIFTGGTRNGKSVLADLMKYTLGDYFTSIKSTLLTGEQGSSSSASPDLMALYRKRFVVASEPEKGKGINSGFMKGITGNDDIVARPLYGNVTTFKPSHSLVLLCNGIPKMDEQDAAVWARSVVVPFPMTFVENPQGPLEKMIDKTLKTRIKEWGPQLMLVFTEWYGSTNEYVEDSNPALMWFNTCTTADPESKFHLSEAFPKFCEWHMQTQGIAYRGQVKTFGKELRQGGVQTELLRVSGNPNVGVRGRGIVN